LKKYNDTQQEFLATPPLVKIKELDDSKLYKELTTECWSKKPQKRLAFKEIAEKLSKAISEMENFYQTESET